MLSSCPPLFRHELSLNNKKILSTNDTSERNPNSKLANQFRFSERKHAAKSSLNKLVKSARGASHRSIIELSKDAFDQSEKIGKPELFLLPRSKNPKRNSYIDSAQWSANEDLPSFNGSMGSFYNNVRNFYGGSIPKDDVENTNRFSQQSLAVNESYSVKYFDVTSRDIQILSKRLLIKHDRDKKARLGPIRKAATNIYVNRSASPSMKNPVIANEIPPKIPQKEIQMDDQTPKFERYGNSRNGVRLEYRSNASKSSSRPEKAIDLSPKKDDSDTSRFDQYPNSSRNSLVLRDGTQGKIESVLQVDEEIKEESLDGDMLGNSNGGGIYPEMMLLDDPKYRLVVEYGSKILLTASDPESQEIMYTDRNRGPNPEEEAAIRAINHSSRVERARPTRVLSTSMLLEKLQDPRKKKHQAREQYIAAYKGLCTSQDRMNTEKGLSSIPLLKKLRKLPENEIKPKDEFQYKPNLLNHFKIYDLKSMLANPTTQSFSKLLEILAPKDKAKIKPVKIEGNLVKRGRTKSVAYSGY